MARLFNVEVFNQTIGEGKEYVTGEEFYALLGSADSMTAQVIVDAAVTSGTAVEVTFETTNASQAQTWITTASKVNITIAPLSDAPEQDVITARCVGRSMNCGAGSVRRSRPLPGPAGMAGTSDRAISQISTPSHCSPIASEIRSRS